MTSGTRYRLEAAERLRKAQCAAAERELARAQDELARAVQAQAGAQRALDRHTLEAAARDGADVVRSEVRAFELQREAAFTARQAAVARALRSALAQAAAHVTACEAAVARCRGALGAAHAGAQVIERDRERFEHAARKHAERTEQLDLDEHRPAIRGDRKRV